jgi:hypothetical protein
VRRAVLFVLLAGCGFRITGANSDGGLIDADGSVGNDAFDAPGDAPIDGPLPTTCLLAWFNHTIAFDQGTAIATTSSTSYERDPFVSADELTLWFSSGGANSQGDVFVAVRSSIGDPFGSPVRDDAFSTSGGAESKMSMTSARTFAVFASNMSGGSGGTDIWERSRPNANAAWGQIGRTHVMGLETSSSELDPFVSPDGLHIYWAPLSPSPQHLVLDELDTPSGESDPMVFASDRIIVFSSRRASMHASGNLWYATRQSTSDPFGAPVELAGVNTDFDDADAHVSPDGCRIYFARNVGGGVDWELFSATAQL